MSATPTALKAWEGCVGSRLTPNNIVPEYAGIRFLAIYDGGLNDAPFSQLTRYRCPVPLLTLTHDLDVVTTKVNSLTAAGQTFIPSGLMWGWRILDERFPYQNVTSGKPRQKILVMMTDGGNTITQTPGSAYHWDNSSEPGFEDVRARADERTRDICEAINLNTGITVYSIAFDTSSASVIDMVRNCASTPDNFFEADDDGASLENAFESIGAGLVKIRLLN